MRCDEKGCPGGRGGPRAARGKGPPPPPAPHPPSAAVALPHPLLPPRLATPAAPSPPRQPIRGPLGASPTNSRRARGRRDLGSPPPACRRGDLTRQALGAEETGETAPPLSLTVAAGSRDRPPPIRRGGGTPTFGGGSGAVGLGRASGTPRR